MQTKYKILVAAGLAFLLLLLAWNLRSKPVQDSSNHALVSEENLQETQEQAETPEVTIPTAERVNAGPKVLPKKQPVLQVAAAGSRLVTMRSRGWRAPLAHARILRTDTEPVAWEADEMGRIPEFKWSDDLRMRLELENTKTDPENPKLQANQSFLLSSIATVRIKAPADHGPPAKGSIDACVWTASGEIWPVPVVSLAAHGDEWILRIEERKDFTFSDPAEQIIVRMPFPRENILRAQRWTPLELQKGLVKALEEWDTGSLDLDLSSSPHSEESQMGQQTFEDFRLLQEDPILEISNQALSGWFACPRQARWKITPEKLATLGGIPVGTYFVHAEMSGTAVTSTLAIIQKDATFEANIWQMAGGITGGMTGGTSASTSEFDLSEIRSSLRRALHVSTSWTSTGNMIDMEFYNEGHTFDKVSNRGTWSVLLPRSDVHCWSLFQASDRGEMKIRWGTESGPPSLYKSRTLPKRPKLQLSEVASTAWSGDIALHLFAWEWKNGTWQVQSEVHEFHWPEDAGKRFYPRSNRNIYTFWYATSSAGEGAFGPIGSAPDSAKKGICWIDPSMAEGWSALTSVQRKSPTHKRSASVLEKTLRKGRRPSDWVAAAGLFRPESGLLMVQTQASQYGVSLMHAAAMPTYLVFQIPGILEKRVVPDPKTNFYEIKVR